MAGELAIDGATGAVLLDPNTGAVILDDPTAGPCCPGSSCVCNYLTVTPIAYLATFLQPGPCCSNYGGGYSYLRHYVGPLTVRCDQQEPGGDYPCCYWESEAYANGIRTDVYDEHDCTGTKYDEFYGPVTFRVEVRAVSGSSNKRIWFEMSNNSYRAFVGGAPPLVPGPYTLSNTLNSCADYTAPNVTSIIWTPVYS